jgi:hypothetical protein
MRRFKEEEIDYELYPETLYTDNTKGKTAGYDKLRIVKPQQCFNPLIIKYKNLRTNRFITVPFQFKDEKVVLNPKYNFFLKLPEFFRWVETQDVVGYRYRNNKTYKKELERIKEKYPEYFV